MSEAPRPMAEYRATMATSAALPGDSGLRSVATTIAGALAAVLTLDLAPEDQVLAGFANSGVLSVVVLYVVAAGMYRTGAISLIIDRLLGVPASEPAANRKLLPLTGLAVAEYGDELEIFFPTRIGLPAAVVGLLFLLVAGNRLISHRTAEDDAAAMTVNTYRADFQVKARLEGRTVGRAGLAAPAGTTLLAIRRDDQAIPGPAPEVVLEPGDVLEYDATVSAVGNLWTTMA